jgi:hypothetical protein
MPVLKEKAEQNREAFELLCQASKYASSVHCIYYHCLQLSKHVLKVHLGTSYLQQKANGSVNSHDYVRSEVAKNLLDTASNHVSNMFSKHFNKLKRLRVQADYSDSEINEDHAKKAFGFAREIDNMLKEYYIKEK